MHSNGPELCVLLSFFHPFGCSFEMMQILNINNLYMLLHSVLKPDRNVICVFDNVVEFVHSSINRVNLLANRVVSRCLREFYDKA